MLMILDEFVTWKPCIKGTTRGVQKACDWLSWGKADDYLSGYLLNQIIDLYSVKLMLRDDELFVDATQCARCQSYW